MNSQLRRTVLDFAPLVLFFTAYKFAGLYAATATVMVAATASAAIGYWLDRKLHPVPLATAVLVLVFGGLTLYLNNDMFIKMKPTIYYGLVGCVLIGGLFFNRPLIKYLFGAVAPLDDVHWRVLSWRFAFFFIGMAILNELIWRNFSNDIWVDFHVFGAAGLTLMFSISQVPFMLKHQLQEKSDGQS